MLAALAVCSAPRRAPRESTRGGAATIQPATIQPARRAGARPSIHALSMVSKAYMAGTDCPTHMQGAMYNHISKTGGTSFWRLMQATFFHGGGHVPGKDHDTGLVSVRTSPEQPMLLMEQDDLAGTFHGTRRPGKGVVTAEHAQNFFVFGLVRRPCDFMLSEWIQQNGFTSKAASDKELFNRFIVESLNRSAYLSATPTMDEALDTKVLSDRVKARYGGGHVHCMASTHSMKEDFVSCALKYKACGGTVNSTHLEDSYLDAAIAAATEAAHAHGRSAGDHIACESMYDDETMKAVQEKEQDLIDQLKLGSCC